MMTIFYLLVGICAIGSLITHLLEADWTGSKAKKAKEDRDTIIAKGCAHQHLNPHEQDVYDEWLNDYLSGP